MQKAMCRLFLLTLACIIHSRPVAMAHEVGWRELPKVVGDADLVIVGKTVSFEESRSVGMKRATLPEALRSMLKTGDAVYTDYHTHRMWYVVTPERVLRGSAAREEEVNLLYEERNTQGVIVRKDGTTGQYRRASYLYTGSRLERRGVLKIGENAVFLVNTKEAAPDFGGKKTLKLLRVEKIEKEKRIRQLLAARAP